MTKQAWITPYAGTSCPCSFPRAKQHAKITLLAWTNYVRLIVASANLTKSGYRYNQEVTGTIEITPEAAHREQLSACCDFLESLIGFVPSAAQGDTACQRALDFVSQVRAQVGSWSEGRKRSNHLTPNLVFTLPKHPGRSEGVSALESCLAICRKHGNAPSKVRIASPFFDTSKAEAEDMVTAALCKGMARGTKRRLTLCVPTVGDDKAESVRLAAPASIYQTAENRVDDLKIMILPTHDSDGNLRPWHAKMVGLKSTKYRALLVGSSNFTKAGMGIGSTRNTEANLLYIMKRQD